MLFRSRWYCCIIDGSLVLHDEVHFASFPSTPPDELPVNFLVETESNTTANPLCQAAIAIICGCLTFHLLDVKTASLAQFDGESCAEYSPAHRFTVFPKQGE